MFFQFSERVSWLQLRDVQEILAMGAASASGLFRQLNQWERNWSVREYGFSSFISEPKRKPTGVIDHNVNEGKESTAMSF